jgi:hypothetical protein
MRKGGPVRICSFPFIALSATKNTFRPVLHALLTVTIYRLTPDGIRKGRLERIEFECDPLSGIFQRNLVTLTVLSKCD